MYGIWPMFVLLYHAALTVEIRLADCTVYNVHTRQDLFLYFSVYCSVCSKRLVGLQPEMKNNVFLPCSIV